MARGQPDYGMYAPQIITANLSDMAELAARLGSIDIFDRLGKVICLDGFESPVLSWDTVELNGATVVLDSTYIKSLAQGVKLSVANQASSRAAIMKGFALPLSDRIGCELGFSVPDTNTYLDLILEKYDGTNLHSTQIRLDFNGGNLIYYDENGLPQNFATGVKFSTETYIYHPIKFAVDFETDNYIRCVYGGVSYDLSSYSLESSSDNTAPYIAIGIWLTQRVQAAASIYIDDFILTQDEP